MTSGAFTIRKGTRADAPAIAVIRRRASLGALPHLPDLHMPDEDLTFFRDRVLAQHEVWVDTDRNGAVVGFCVLYAWSRQRDEVARRTSAGAGI
jgi:hypothetical protein